MRFLSVDPFVTGASSGANPVMMGKFWVIRVTEELQKQFAGI